MRSSIKKTRSTTHTQKRGFTVLMAVLVAILVLAIASSLVRIVLKQVKFSGSGRESQISYYVADTGIECALLWDFRSTELFQDTSGESLEAFPEPASRTAPPPPNVENIPPGAAYDDMVATMKCGEYSIVENGSPELKEFNRSTGTYGWIDGTGKSPDGLFDSVYRTFQFVLSDGGSKRYCGTVRVEKWFDDTTGIERVRTMIDSRGYNNCSGNVGTRYERGLRADY